MMWTALAIICTGILAFRLGVGITSRHFARTYAADLLEQQKRWNALSDALTDLEGVVRANEASQQVARDSVRSVFVGDAIEPKVIELKRWPK